MVLKDLISSSAQKPVFLMFMTVALGLSLLHPVRCPAANPAAIVAAKSDTKKPEEEVKIPEGLSPEEVDEYLAGLSDTQARELLARRLKENKDEDILTDITGEMAAEDDPADQLFHKLTLGATVVIDEIVASFSSGKEGEPKWPYIISRLSGGLGLGHVMLTVLIAIGMIICGILVERLVLRLTANLQEQILTSVTLGRLQRIGRFLSRLLLELLGLGAYILTTFVLLIAFYRQEEAAYWIISEILIASYYVKAVIFAAIVIMAPKSRP